MRTADELCSAITEKQSGLIARQQAVRAGMSAAGVGRRLASRRWLQVLPGVYRLAGSPTSWEQSLKAATLWGGDKCVVSHETAASLHGLSVLGGRRVHLQSPRQLRHANIAAHRTRFSDFRPVVVKGIPATSVTRTLIDLSASLPTKSLEQLLDEAIRRGMTDIARLKGGAAPFRRPPARHTSFAPIDRGEGEQRGKDGQRAGRRIDATHSQAAAAATGRPLQRGRWRPMARGSGPRVSTSANRD